jgi:ATP phosphoribosyltransferase
MPDTLRLLLPKGRIQARVFALLERIGLAFSNGDHSLRPGCAQPWVEAKLLKPQNIPALISLGRHDAGFTGHDWVVEQAADVLELADLTFDPVRIVAAMPESLAAGGWQTRPIVVASEYRNLAARYIREKQLNAVFVPSYGATEALPPEDADMIIDNTATGATLRHNHLVIVDELMRSTTRFVANRQAMENPDKRRMLEEMTMLIRSTLNASERVLLEMNVPRECFDQVVASLPCMRSPTVAPLYGDQGFAVKVAVERSAVPALVPRLVAMGARDILEYRLEKIVASEAQPQGLRADYTDAASTGATGDCIGSSKADISRTGRVSDTGGNVICSAAPIPPPPNDGSAAGGRAARKSSAASAIDIPPAFQQEGDQ